jgi:hypothetical protein
MEANGESAHINRGARNVIDAIVQFVGVVPDISAMVTRPDGTIRIRKRSRADAIRHIQEHKMYFDLSIDTFNV